MKMPGFTAEASLVKKISYCQIRSVAFNSEGDKVIPQMLRRVGLYCFEDYEAQQSRCVPLYADI